MVIERKTIERVSINPDFSSNLWGLIEAIEKIPNISLLKIGFESSGKSSRTTKKTFGKNNKVRANVSDKAIIIPRQIHKITEDFTLADLKDAITALETYAVREIPTYKFDAYPVSLTLCDKGRPPNLAYHIVEFDKVRKISKNSEYAKMLGSIHMPIDLISIHKADFDKKAINDTSKTAYRKIDVIRDIKNPDVPYVEADDVFHYTRNIYHSDFTEITSCVVGIETKETVQITEIEGGGCSVGKKRPDTNNNHNEEVIEEV